MAIVWTLVAAALPLAVVANGLAVVGFAALAFYDLPVGWAIALSGTAALQAMSGYKLMRAGNADPKLLEFYNSFASETVVLLVLLALMVWFSLSLAPTISQWWAVLALLWMPLNFLSLMVIMGVLEFINPDGGQRASSQRVMHKR